MVRYRLIVTTALLVVLCAFTISRSAVYYDEVSLYSDVVAKSPNKARPHNNLGDALKKANRFEEAGPQFERALELQQDYPDALNNLATIYNSSGRSPEALQLLSRALALDPGHRQARFNLAFTFYDRGMLSESEQQFAILMQTAPESKEAVFAQKMLALIQKRKLSQ
jgi:protein O-mannosyl-transferase